jgi:hypothetical protein
MAWYLRFQNDKCHKEYRPPHDKTSGLSFHTAIYLMSTKTYTDIPDEQTKKNKKRERTNTYSQTSRLENPEELSLHHNLKKSLFLTVLLLFAQFNMHHW